MLPERFIKSKEWKYEPNNHNCEEKSSLSDVVHDHSEGNQESKEESACNEPGVKC